MNRGNTDPIVGLLLAGGWSTRMGEDKALLPYLEKETFLSHSYYKLKTYCDFVYVSIRKEQLAQYSSLYPDIEFVPDSNSSWKGPLRGIFSLYEFLSLRKTSPPILVLPVDMPLVRTELLANLILRYNMEKKGIFYRTEQGIEPLCAVYDWNLLDRWFKERISEGENTFSPKRKLENSDILILDLSSEERRYFSNINSPNDRTLLDPNHQG